MRAFADKLSSKDHQVIYIKLDDSDNRQSFEENLRKIIDNKQIEKFEYQLPDEYRLDEEFRSFCREIDIPSGYCDTEHFYTSRNELAEFFKGKKTYRLESFYRHLRKKHQVMMAGDQPEGGKWNFDKENRNKLEDGVPVPRPHLFSHDHTGIFEMIKRMEVPCFGEIDPKKFFWPVNRAESLELMNSFLKNLLPQFGTYQDAMDASYWSLFHSRISFSMNTKMLSPREVVDFTIDHWKANQEIGINQVEGFVRQIIGWREYMRGIYWAQMPDFAKMNFFENDRKLPGFYWTGHTKMNCLKHSISQSLEKAYAHHIQRLMVTGNFALLAGVYPDETDRWYLGIYMDAIEWVEITNTRGMSQFADGGITATKPYVSSANYIRKMSNYCDSCHYDPKKKTGVDACPFNSLYWSFMERNRKKLENNPRIGMIYRSWDRMNKDNKEEILKQAAEYLDKIELL
jgi:deoxyribodipyrimidine photolyase-related protein